MNDFATTRLRPLRHGILLTFLAVLYGFALTAFFSAADKTIKDKFRADAMAVLDEVYGGDEGLAVDVTKKAWVYFKRASVYAGGLAAVSLVLIVLLALAGPPGPAAQAAAVGMGGGSLVFGLYWMFSAMNAPSVGGTANASKDLLWFGGLGGGAAGLGVCVTMFLTLRACWGRND